MQSPQQALKNFQQHFPEEARLFFSPGTIHLFGEHIDINGGNVLSSAINKGIWFAIAPNNSNTATIVASENDIDDSFSVDISHIAKQSGWKNIVLGVVHILKKKKYEIRGFNCLFGGNFSHELVNSSSVLETGLVFALNEIFELGLSKKQMTLIAQEAEHNFLLSKCGIMDLFTSLHGKDGNCLLLDSISLEYEHLPLNLISENEEYELVIIDSKVNQELSSGLLNKRYEESMEGLSFFQTLNKKMTSFRHIHTNVVEQFRDNLSDEVYKRCVYITQEIERSKQAASYLKDNNLTEFGQLMYLSHNGLSELFEVSCREVDYLVNEAKSQFDVIGSRMIGGGYVGSTINLVNKRKRDEVIGNIVTAFERSFNIMPDIYVVETSEGTREIPLVLL